MSHQHRHAHVSQNVAGDPTEDHFTQARVAVSPHNQEISIEPGDLAAAELAETAKAGVSTELVDLADRAAATEDFDRDRRPYRVRRWLRVAGDALRAASVLEKAVG
jgi:hypothetical protein